MVRTLETGGVFGFAHSSENHQNINDCACTASVAALRFGLFAVGASRLFRLSPCLTISPPFARFAAPERSSAREFASPE
jgi:hypothetical protein